MLFAHSTYLYLLLALPVFIALHYVMYRVQQKRLRIFGDSKLLKALMPEASIARKEIKFWLVQLALMCLIIALARPQFGTKMETRKRQGIESIIALDVSNSMLAQDVTPSRLDKAKMMISRLVEDMEDDKVGLIVYAGEAFIQLPITSDYVSAKMFLEPISTSMIDVQGTDIRNAIEMASNSFTANEKSTKAIFVITDGEDNEGGAVEAAREAAKKGIRVYVLGIGSPKGAPIPLSNGRDYIVDNQGQVVVSKLNEDMCREIASAGNGAYIYVDNSSSAQSALLKYVDDLGKIEMEQTVYAEKRELFPLFVSIALILLILDILIAEKKNPRFSKINIFKMNNRVGVLLFLVLSSLTLFAQKNERDLLRNGNRMFRDSMFSVAETEYLKAIEVNPRMPQAHYNLGLSLQNQHKDEEALKEYDEAIRRETNPLRIAQSYHNKGVSLQDKGQYAQAIENYKEALRKNSADNETRYNLAMCQYLLKNQKQESKSDSTQQQQQKEQQQQEQEKKEEKKEQNKSQQKRTENNISKENYEQMLKAAMQEEKKTQEKVKKAMMPSGRRKLEKQW